VAKGYWIARIDVKNEEGYKPYRVALTLMVTALATI